MEVFKYVCRQDLVGVVNTLVLVHQSSIYYALYMYDSMCRIDKEYKIDGWICS